MPQDYVKSAAHHKRQMAHKKSTQLPSGLIVITLLTAIALALFLYYLAQLGPKTKETVNRPDQTSSAAKVPKQKKNIKAPATEETYDFYTLLPESEVIAPKVEEYSSTMKDTESETAYLLQAGSFRNRSDADRLRAKLIMHGLDVRMQAVKSGDGSTWHRILLGPFESRSKLNQAQDILADENTESMLIKIKAGK